MKKKLKVFIKVERHMRDEMDDTEKKYTSKVKITKRKT